MKPSDLKNDDELLAEHLKSDPGFREEWERTALGRAVAIELVRYRAEHGLSQRALADRLGMKQPNVARLELGEINPKIETLMALSSHLALEFTIRIRPETEPKLVVAPGVNRRDASLRRRASAHRGTPPDRGART